MWERCKGSRRQGATAYAKGSERRSGDVLESESVSSSAGGGGGFSHQAGQCGQIEPDVSLEDEGPALGVAADGQTLETPAFEGGVAALDGVAGAVVETFPGRGAHGNITHLKRSPMLMIRPKGDESRWAHSSGG